MEALQKEKPDVGLTPYCDNQPQTDLVWTQLIFADRENNG